MSRVQPELGLGAEAVPHLRRLADWSPRCRLRRARTMTGSVAYAAAASSPVASRTSSSHPGIPAMGDRMSAIGRRAGDGDGFAEGVGEAGVGSAVTGAEALAVLLVAGAAIPATGAGACDVAATACAVTPEAGADVDLPGAVDCEVLVPAGVADAVGLAAPVLSAPAGEAARLVVAGLAEAALAAGDAWPPDGALDRLARLALAVGVV